MAKRVKVRSYKRKTKSGVQMVKSFTRSLLTSALNGLAPHSPVVKKKKAELLERRRKAAETTKVKPEAKDRYQIRDSSNQVLSVSSKNKGHKLKPGQYIVDTHKVQNNNGRKWKIG